MKHVLFLKVVIGTFVILSVMLALAKPQAVAAPVFQSVSTTKYNIENSTFLPWDTAELYKKPVIYLTDSCAIAGFDSFFYEGLEYKSKRTRVFAYYKKPSGNPPEGGWPAVVCAHGGGGTAFPEWVQAWVDHGFAAISMDLEGHLPKGTFPNRQWHEYAGPARITTFGDIELADREQWFYHAVADVIKANSLLRSFPEINKNKIGIHGISWGGVITSAAMGIDHRLAFAIPVYGCGFLYESTAPNFKKYFDVMTASQLQDYKSKWDPSLYLADCRIPALFYIGSNDGAFPLDIWHKSAMMVSDNRILSVPVSKEHGHIWNQKEIFAFADAVVRNGDPLIHAAVPSVTGGIGSAALVSFMGGKLPAASPVTTVLVYTKDSGDWQLRKWQTLPAQIADRKVVCKLPDSVTVFYFNITDARGDTFSSPYKSLK